MPNINYTLINYDDIVEELKTFIKNTSDFNSYNFNSSNLTLVCNMLGYITNILNMYLNQSVNEVYLDSVTLRKNLLGIIKLLNYVPARTNSAIVYADLVATPTTTPTDAVIDRYQTFTAGDYTFYNTEQIIFQNSNSYTQTEIKLTEGILTETTYTGDGNNFQEFIIEDTSMGDYLRVWTYALDVNNNETTDVEEWDLYTETLFIENGLNAKIFFLEEIETGYKITFGNGTFGYAPAVGRVIHIDYLTSAGSAANNLTENDFSFSGTGTNLDDVALTFSTATGYETTVSFNGSEKESIESIKFNAPKFYSTQGRAVTDDDYKSIALRHPLVAKVNVIGGENLDPVQLGKVFLYAKPKTGLLFTPTQLTEIRDYLLDYSVITINPIVNNPDYIYMEVTSNIRYTSAIPNITTIKNAIDEYINNTSQEFEIYFKHSRFSDIIDESDSLISSNITTVLLYRLLSENDNVQNNDYSLYLCKRLAEGFGPEYDPFAFYIDKYDLNDVFVSRYFPYQLDTYTLDLETGLLTFTESTIDLDNYNYRIYFAREDDDIFTNFGQILYLDIDNKLTLTFEQITL